MRRRRHSIEHYRLQAVKIGSNAIRSLAPKVISPPVTSLHGSKFISESRFPMTTRRALDRSAMPHWIGMQTTYCTGAVDYNLAARQEHGETTQQSDSSQLTYVMQPVTKSSNPAAPVTFSPDTISKRLGRLEEQTTLTLLTSILSPMPAYAAHRRLCTTTLRRTRCARMVGSLAEQEHQLKSSRSRY